MSPAVVLPPPAGTPVTAAQPAPGEQPPAADRDGEPRKRSLQKKVIRPVALAIIAVLSGLAAWWVYPSRTQLPSPAYTTLQLQSPFAVDAVNYAVHQQPGSATARIEIAVLLSESPQASLPPARKTATLWVFPPVGVAFGRCLPQFCSHLPGDTYAWHQPLTFRPASGPSLLPDVNGSGIYAFLDLQVRLPDFGVISDGATAAAAVPKLIDDGPGSPNLLTRYSIPAANRYDWSGFPPAFADGTSAEWLEQMTSPGDIPDLEATGVNHTAQAQDNDLTFLAGALVGVAGGALLSAFQEALHAND